MRILGFIAFLVFSLPGLAQLKNENIDYPEIGKPCPDFVLQDIRYHPKKRATLGDFKGKWLLLDFWNRSCGACIASFPRMSDMQKELGDRVQVMMVAIQDPERQVDLIYSRYRDKEKLVMPCDFDSALARRFDIAITPRSILIDDKGVVQCITNTIHVDEMKKFLEGEHPILPKAYRMNEDAPKEDDHKMVFDRSKPFMINGNGANDTDYLYRSVLAAWKPTSPFLMATSINLSLKFSNKGGFQVLGAPLTMLYFYAYLGRMEPAVYEEGYYNKAILELNDSSLFKYSYKEPVKNMFSYAVNMSPLEATGERVQGIMQGDLKNYFGYEVVIEKRNCPCWRLIATDAAREKLKTSGGPFSVNGAYNIGYSAKNISFKEVLRIMRVYIPDEIILDETGITGNVDIQMDCKGCILANIEDVKRALQANGLDLVRSTQEMKALVIRDKRRG